MTIRGYVQIVRIRTIRIVQLLDWIATSHDVERDAMGTGPRIQALFQRRSNLFICIRYSLALFSS